MTRTTSHRRNVQRTMPIPLGTLLGDRGGSGLAEYVVAVGLVAVCSIAGFRLLGRETDSKIRCYAEGLATLDVACSGAADSAGRAAPPFAVEQLARGSAARAASRAMQQLDGASTEEAIGQSKTATGRGGNVPWERFDIQGKKEFVRNVKADLQKIASTRTGRDLLDRLAKTSHTVSIVEVGNPARQYRANGEMRDATDDFRGRGPFAKEESTPDATRDLVPDPNGDYLEVTFASPYSPPKLSKQRYSLGPPKNGSNSTIVLQAAYKDGEERPAFDQPDPASPSDAELNHELGHAVRDAEGTAMPKAVHVKDAKSFAGQWTNLEEYEVTTEVDNAYRRERGLPLREDHIGNIAK